MIYHPRSYQAIGTDFLVANPRAALQMEMGLGKTVSTATAIDILRSFGEVGKVLVLGPKRVVNITWPDEFAKWDHLRHLDIVPITGTAATRQRLLHSDAPVHAINYENVPWLLEYLGDAWPYDLVVADESTKLKNPMSLRFNGRAKQRKEVNGGLVTVPAKRGLKHVAGRTKRWINLTGSPMPKSPHDLWSQMYLLDGGKRLGKNITAFRERWFTQDRYSGSHTWEPFPHSQAEITALIRDRCLTLKAADYLDLPPLVHNRIEFDLPHTAAELYRDLEREFYLDLGEHEIAATNAGVLSGKLRQFTAGALYTNPDGAWEEVHREKLDALDDVIEEAGATPVMVIYHFKSDLVRIRAAFPQARHLDHKPQTVRDWNAGRIPILLVHPASAGHGLNLQGGSNIAVFFSLDFDLDTHDQVIERIGPARQLQSGHPRPVFIHYLVARDTIDELCLERLIERRAMQDIFKEATKRRPK